MHSPQPSLRIIYIMSNAISIGCYRTSFGAISTYPASTSIQSATHRLRAQTIGLGSAPRTPHRFANPSSHTCPESPYHSFPDNRHAVYLPPPFGASCLRRSTRSPEHGRYGSYARLAQLVSTRSSRRDQSARTRYQPSPFKASQGATWKKTTVSPRPGKHVRQNGHCRSVADAGPPGPRTGFPTGGQGAARHCCVPSNARQMHGARW
jgi:hypothetical protein